MPPEARRGATAFGDGEALARLHVANVSDRELLVALVHGRLLEAVVPLALDRVEREPLRDAGRFAGELLRGLMEVPGGFWARHPRLHVRFVAALRAGAALRWQLPPDERMRFWTPLDVPAQAPETGPGAAGEGAVP